MQNNAKASKQVIGIILLLGFLLAFYPNLTGLDLHQIGGSVLGALAIYHAWVHRRWIASIANRLGEATAVRGQLFWLLDAALAAGFAAIVGTGLLISTWVGYAGAYLDLLIDVHVIGSLLTLALVLVKVATHWRWFVPTAKTEQRARVPAQQAAPSTTQGPSRRAFLGLMGTVGLAAVAAGLSGLNRFSQQAVAQTNGAVAETATPLTTSSTAALTATETTSISATTTKTVPTEAAESGTSTATSTATATATAQTAASAATSCRVRCNRGCSYPGHCRKYADANGNGLCDLGECL